MSGLIRFENTLGPGATNSNLVAQTILERLGQRAEVLSVYGVINDDAALVNDVTCEVRLGNVIVVDKAIVPMTALRTGPDRDKHLLARALGMPFDLVQIRLFNGDAAATAAFRFLVELTGV